MSTACGTRCALVVHGPASIDELELAVAHERADGVLHPLGLLVPPTPKVCDLHVNEPAGVREARLRSRRISSEGSTLSSGVQQEALDDGVQDILNASVLDGVVRAIVVLIDRLEPTDILRGAPVRSRGKAL